MITKINEFKKINENDSNEYEIIITKKIGKYSQGDYIDYDVKELFCDDAADIILGIMSLSDYNIDKKRRTPFSIYINDVLTEYPGEGHKLFDISMTKEELVSELLDNYEDYIHDLDEGDLLIMSTTITLVD